MPDHSGRETPIRMTRTLLSLLTPVETARDSTIQQDRSLQSAKLKMRLTNSAADAVCIG
jgi:hypothetical protein